jgi:hypothetical protein
LEDGIEIAYNSAGVLANLCSDGRQNWIDTVGADIDVDEEDQLSWDKIQSDIILVRFVFVCFFVVRFEGFSFSDFFDKCVGVKAGK